jgi:hypothetical protein
MLDAEQRFMLSGLPGVWVFADDRDPTGFYALPAKPRIASDDGRAQLGLVLYGKNDHGSFVPRGGVLTLTTALTLAQDELQQVMAGLSRKLAAAASGDGSPVLPRLLAADVTAASVQVQLTTGVSLAGTPSSAGGYRCSLNEKLDADQARALRTAWSAGLPEARGSYRLELRPRPASSSAQLSSVTFSQTQGDETTTGSHAALGLHVTAAQAATLVVEGGLDVGSIGDQLSEVAL